MLERPTPPNRRLVLTSNLVAESAGSLLLSAGFVRCDVMLYWLVHLQTRISSGYQNMNVPFQKTLEAIAPLWRPMITILRPPSLSPGSTLEGSAAGMLLQSFAGAPAIKAMTRALHHKLNGGYQVNEQRLRCKPQRVCAVSFIGFAKYLASPAA